METQAIESTKETRVRGPALENLADIRRQAKRLFVRFYATGEDEGVGGVGMEKLHVAVSPLTLIKSTILEEQALPDRAAAQRAAQAAPEPASQEVTPAQEPLAPPPEWDSRVPARFRVPKP